MNQDESCVQCFSVTCFLGTLSLARCVWGLRSKRRFVPGERRGLGALSAAVAETLKPLLRDGQSSALVRRALQNGMGRTGSEAGTSGLRLEGHCKNLEK